MKAAYERVSTAGQSTLRQDVTIQEWQMKKPSKKHLRPFVVFGIIICVLFCHGNNRTT